MVKFDEKGSVCCVDKDSREQIMFELGERPEYRIHYFNQKLYFSKEEDYKSLFSFDLDTKKSEQIEQIQLYYGRFTIVDDFVLFINRQRNSIVMNL